MNSYLATQLKVLAYGLRSTELFPHKNIFIYVWREKSGRPSAEVPFYPLSERKFRFMKFFRDNTTEFKEPRNNILGNFF